MYSTTVLRWAQRYELDPAIVFEAIEIVCDSIEDVADEPHLLRILTEYMRGMIDVTLDDPDVPHLRAFILHIIPMMHKLEPYLDTNDKRELQDHADGDTNLISASVFTMLNPDYGR